MNDTPDNKNLPAGSAKRSSPLLRILPLAVLAAVLVYFAAQIHSYFSDPMTVTVTYESQAEDTVSMEGWLVRTEEPLPAQSGTVSRQVQEGQRVAAGQTVATVSPAATRWPSCTARDTVPVWPGSGSSVRTSQPSMEITSSACAS